MTGKHNIPSDDYFAGFTDGEGSFALTVRRDVRHERKSKAVYYSWKALFAIVLRYDDAEILYALQKRYMCGTITFQRTNARYQVGDLTDLHSIIIPFFKKNKIFGKKGKDFTLWSEAVDILQKYKNLRGYINLEKGKKGFQKVQWEENDIQRLLEIQEQSSIYKSKRKNKRKWVGEELGRG